MRSKVVLLVLGLHCAFFLLAAVSFVEHHGGAEGDFDRSLVEAAPHASNAYAGRVYFNRWVGSFDQDPWIYKLFVWLNTPANLVGHAVYKLGQAFVPELREPFPYGVAYPSYTRVLMLMLSPVQWFLFGIALDRGLRSLRSRRSRNQ